MDEFDIVELPWGNDRERGSRFTRPRYETTPALVAGIPRKNS
jgi:hypothetical protein